MPATVEAPVDREYLAPKDCRALFGGSIPFWTKKFHEKLFPVFRLGEVLLRARKTDIEAWIIRNAVDGPARCRDGRRNGKQPGPKPRAAR